MKIQKTYWVYIIANKANTVIYIGVTNNLARRISEHKTKSDKGFSARYNISKLIYFETFDDINLAIKREKELKGWTRKKKDQLINQKNATWLELEI